MMERERFEPVQAGDWMEDATVQWRWRNLRDIGVGFRVWPLHWWPLFFFEKEDDQYGGGITLALGPVEILFDYNAHDGPLGKPMP